MAKKNTFLSPSLESQTIEDLSKQLFEANLQLQQIQKERSEILANLSHDLRAPITAIRSTLDYLSSNANLSLEEYQSSMQIIDRRTKTLENLIQDMYYLFCIEDTTKQLQFVTIDAAPFLEEYFYDTLIDTRFSKHNLHLEMDEQLTCCFSIDIQKIIRVLDNLFTNAAKYSPAGSDITFRITLNKGDSTLLVEIIDTGIGIPADAVPNIFNRTYTVSSARTPNSSTGSGLGLAIVKAIIERHNGTVGCKSIEGQGSCFHFRLPVKY